MELLLFILILIGGAGLVINHAFFQKERAIYVQTIFYLNRVLNELKDIKSYYLTKRFYFSQEYIKCSLPTINEVYLDNPSYKGAVDEFKGRVKTYRVLNYVLGALVFILILYLWIAYPQFVEGIFDNNTTL